MFKKSTSVPFMLALICSTASSAFQTFTGNKHIHNARYQPVRRAHDLEEHVFDSAELRHKKPLWEQLQQVAKLFQEGSGRVMFNVKELEKHDAGIVSRLKQEESIHFEVPKTWKAAVSIFLGRETIQFILSVFSATAALRLSLPEALGLTDVATIILTRILWEAQEWTVHSRWFHGNEGAMTFETHDNHHMLPYYHVAIEPTRICVIWFAVVASIASAAVKILRVPAAVASTSLATHTCCGLSYIGMHYMTHTKVPLTGWLQQARQNHIKHHLSPEENLNMGPNNFDKIMKTQSCESRFHRMKN